MAKSSGQITGNVFLIGSSGSGKSTVGPRLARRLGVAFCDTDQLIEEAAGKSIDQIFKRDGESVFRAYESEVIVTLVNGLTTATVIALGGGAFQNRASRKLVGSAGLVVYLSCSARELYRRVRACQNRPLLNAREEGVKSQRKELLERIQKLLSLRRANYRKADIIYSTTGKDVGTTVSDLAGLIRKQLWHK